MGSRYKVELTIESARDLKNVNWRNGDLRAYAVAWVDPAAKFSTKADVDGDTNPVWDEKLIIPIPGDLSVLFIDVVHAGPGVKPLVGSARLPLREILDEAGVGGKVTRSLKLKRPSGRPHGRIEVKVRVADRDPPRYYDPYAPPYGQPAASHDYPGYGGAYGQSAASHDYPRYGGAHGQPYAAAPLGGYPYRTPPAMAGYGYGAPPPQAAGYGYEQQQGERVEYGQEEKQPYTAEKVEADLGYDDGAHGQPYAAAPLGGYPYRAPPATAGYGYGAPPPQAAGYGYEQQQGERVEYGQEEKQPYAAEKVEDDLGYDDGVYSDDF